MSKAILNVVVFAAILGYSAPSWADIFRVVTRGGAILKFVRYEVLDHSKRRIKRGATDSLGRFFLNRAPGNYSVIFHWRGQSNPVAIPIHVDGRNVLKRIVLPIK
jgi:hypothetical protein